MIPIQPAGAVALFAGRSFPANAEALFARFPTVNLPTGEKLPVGQGFLVERSGPEGDTRTMLALTRAPTGDVEMFLTMARDVVGCLDAEAAEGADELALLRAFLGRVKAWQEFMRNGSRALSAEAEAGLVGELATIHAMAEAGVPLQTALEAWRGPYDGLHDFEIGKGAVEVKATLAPAGFIARISSLNQLDDKVLQPLFVAAVRLRQVASGKTLPEIVGTTKGMVASVPAASRLLADALVAVGYFAAQAGRYDRHFEIADIRLIEVSDGFPRLIHGNVPAAVSWAQYEIDLDKVGSPPYGLPAALKKLGAI